jgi:hypothetical protein
MNTSYYLESCCMEEVAQDKAHSHFLLLRHHLLLPKIRPNLVQHWSFFDDLAAQNRSGP